MKEIFVVETYTGTVLSRIIKKVTNVPYPHVSIALDRELTDMYSFGRIYISNPFIAGFVKEGINKGLYEKKKKSICRVIKIDVSEEKYCDLKIKIDEFYKDRKKYKYDGAALIKFVFKIPQRNSNKYVCSQFVAYVLEYINLNMFNKGFRYVTPLDFYNLKDVEVVYEGLTSEYAIENQKKIS